VTREFSLLTALRDSHSVSQLLEGSRMMTHHQRVMSRDTRPRSSCILTPTASGTKTSATLETLFKVDEDCEKLRPKKAQEFHNLDAKTLYATKQARPDTCTAITFLTTRVRAPDKDDWSKLTHLMKYIRGTRDLPLILHLKGHFSGLCRLLYFYLKILRFLVQNQTNK
jgi:hypothetical protein